MVLDLGFNHLRNIRKQMTLMCFIYFFSLNKIEQFDII